MIHIRPITADRRPQDARLPNQPFPIWGRMIPALQEGRWTYRTEVFPQLSELCFPDETYTPGTDGAIYLGAYDGETCVGLAVLRRGMFRYLYLEDLKVDRLRRGRGVGGMLIEASMEEAAGQALQGVYTVGQDNNLTACLFYLHHGFQIGGFDNRAYGGTSQEGKADIYFYRDL